MSATALISLEIVVVILLVIGIGFAVFKVLKKK